MRPRAEQGFTLIELLVTMTLASVVFGGTLTVVEVFQRQSSYDQIRNENQDNARTALDRMARNLRNVIAPTTKYEGALEQAGAYSLVFRTVDPTGKSASQQMVVRYCLDDSKPTEEIIREQVKHLSSSSESVGSTTTCEANRSEWETRQIVQHVTNEIDGKNRPLFEYGPKPTEVVSEITAVFMNLYIKGNSGELPGETELTTGVSLRNANRKPEAKFTITPIGQHEFLLNASESYDPDGLALSYKWWMNGVEQSSTSQIWQTSKLEKGKSYTIKLEVTNPGGLSNYVEKMETAQ